MWTRDSRRLCSTTAGALFVLATLAGPVSCQADPAAGATVARRTTPPGWKVEGWIEGDYSASSARRSNLPAGFQLFADHAHLHQAWLRLDYPMVKEGPRRLGAHLDLYAGTDYFFTRARGLLGGQTGEIGLDPLQFYLEGRVDGLGQGSDVRVGRFSSPIDVEYNAGPLNLLPSHTYSFIYDPFTHTGVYAQTTLNSSWTLLNGVVTGSDIFVDPAARATFLNGVRYVDVKDANKSLQIFTILGPGRFDVERGVNHVDVIDVCATHPLGGKLLFSWHSIFGWQSGVPGPGDVNWTGLVPYLTWTVSDRLSATLRLEYFDDGDGNRTGFAGQYRTATLGAVLKPAKWLAIRPEIRFDDHVGDAPFEGRNHLATATLNAYVKW